MEFKRPHYQKLLKEATEREISIIIGPRQVGKSTLLQQLHQELSQTTKTLFLDLDILSNFEKVSTYELLIQTITAAGYTKDQPFILFLDEFQRYSDISRIMKNVYDHHKNVKIYASGSSSLTIKNQIQESLAGRKILTHVLPLSFAEFLTFKQAKDELVTLDNIHKLQGKDLAKMTTSLRHYLEEFMIYGGYPAVVLEKSNNKKPQILANIFDLYVKKDLVEYLSITKILHVKKMIEFLAINNGQKIQYSEISQLTSLQIPTVKNYLEILQETYLIQEIRPYFTNKNKELAKIPKIFFLDTGVRNYFIKTFTQPHLRADIGFLFETFIFTEILKQDISQEIKFWNNKNLQEVDFVIQKSSSLIGLEVKFKETLKKVDYSGIKAFTNDYPNAKTYVINLTIQDNAHRLPFYLENF